VYKMNDTINIVVPAVRHNMAERFMLNTHWPVIAVIHDDPELGVEWENAGASILECNKPTFAEKSNHAYKNSNSDWLLFVGEDVVFKKDWYASLFNYMRVYKVIGTNDLLYSGKQHSPHMLISREYIQNRGGSWDGPDKVFHEYIHNYTDTETRQLAIERKVWIYDHQCVIEHLHHANNKAEIDGVYEIGIGSHKQDKTKYLNRRTQAAAKQRPKR
jgi:hypothetical protein